MKGGIDLNNVLQFIQDNGNVITFIGILLTFLTSAFSLYYSWKSSKSSKYIDTITKNRIEWICNLRDLISEYISLTMITPLSALLCCDDLSIYYRKVRNLNMKIKLMLNFYEEMDKKIILIADELEKASHDYYSFLSFFEDYTAEGLTDLEKDYIIVNNKFSSNYLISYLEEKNMPIEEELHLYNRSDVLSEKLSSLKSKGLEYINFLLNLNAQYEKLNSDILSMADQLTKETQIYLKFEWNRVKREAKGKKYDVEMQKNDLKQLHELYINTHL